MRTKNAHLLDMQSIELTTDVSSKLVCLRALGKQKKQHPVDTQHPYMDTRGFS